MGAWLISRGARPRSHIAVLFAHYAEFLLAQIGVHLSGASCFALETHFGPAMLRDLMADTRPLCGLAGGGGLTERLHAAMPDQRWHDARRSRAPTGPTDTAMRPGASPPCALEPQLMAYPETRAIASAARPS